MVLVLTFLNIFIVISYKVLQLATILRISKCCSRPWLELPTVWQLVLCLWLVETAIVSQCANQKAACTVETRKLVSHQGELCHIVSSKCIHWEGVKEMPWGWPIFWSCSERWQKMSVFVVATSSRLCIKGIDLLGFSIPIPARNTACYTLSSMLCELKQRAPYPQLGLGLTP